MSFWAVFSALSASRRGVVVGSGAACVDATGSGVSYGMYNRESVNALSVSRVSASNGFVETSFSDSKNET